MRKSGKRCELLQRRLMTCLRLPVLFLSIGAVLGVATTVAEDRIGPRVTGSLVGSNGGERGWCLDTLRGPSTPCDKQEAAFHLRNMGWIDDEAAGLLVEGMSSELDEDFLRTAVWAISGVKTTSVTQALCRLAAQTRSETVRRCVYETLQFRRSPEVCRFLLERFAVETSPEERRLLLTGLGRCALDFPEAERVLARASVSDPDPAIRKTARERMELNRRIRAGGGANDGL